MTAPAIREATLRSLDMRCETCGGQAVMMVQDFVRKSWPGTMLVEYRRDGNSHVFCKHHQRKPKVRDLTMDLP